MKHEVYSAIIKAVKIGSLQEPFSKKDFKRACPDFGEGTYNAFLWKHQLGNSESQSELFIKVAPGKFKLVRPIKYGL
jgi:hypothetical protein